MSHKIKIRGRNPWLAQSEQEQEAGARAGIFCVVVVSLLSLSACGGDAPAVPAPRKQDESEVVTNRIAIPPVVRQNLDITFAKVERRNVARTLRVPGRFDHLSTGRVEYRAPAAGRVELHIKQYEHVEEGGLIYTIDSPEWRALQQEMITARKSGGAVTRRLDAIDKKLATLETSRAHWEERIAKLEEINKVGGGRAAELAEARGRLADAQSAMAEAREERAQAELDSIETRQGAGSDNAQFSRALRRAAAWFGLTEKQMLEPVKGEGESLPRWQALDRIEIRANRHAHVEDVPQASGAWVAAGDLVVTGVDHRDLVFRGLGLQSDLGRLRDGQPAWIVPPRGGSLDVASPIPARMEIGLDADPHERTIELLLYPESLTDWTRPGVAAHAEIVIEGAGAENNAIPLAAVMTDGLEKVFFLRDRKDPDKAVRMKADLGVSDGKWIEIKSGVKPGDEVVVNGAYELKLGSSGQGTKAGHFHSDGTFHENHD